MCSTRRHLLTLCLALLSPLAPAFASDDWDWGAVEAIDDAPVTRAPSGGSVAAADAPAPRTPPGPRRPAPDLAAEPVQVQALFRGVAPFEVVAGTRNHDMHPCANCHQWRLSDLEPRRLREPHEDIELRHGLHGKGGFWCFTCHDPQNNLSLKTLDGEPVDYAHAYVVCTQCHVQQGRDWARGAHGKRVGNWQGRRRVYNCTACHYQHEPGIRSRAPLPGPVMRAGLPRPAHWIAAGRRPAGHAEPHKPDWQHDVDRRREAGDQVPAPAPDTAASDAKTVNDAES